MSLTTVPIMTAVITGNHDFEVPEFINLFRALPSIDFYPQSLENYAADLAHVREKYDVLVFYNMHSEPPNEAVIKVFKSLGNTEQGLVFLHHGMLAFRQWPLMGEIVGIPDRSFKYYPGETVSVEIADPGHPITQGLTPWQMVDETYAMADAGADSHVLLTTTHPRSLRTLAWTRTHKKARVFVLASGHGKETYADPNFQTVLQRSIVWAARRV
jgi:type 1 glutamine amidotransferase